jgi:hypothetical protein
MSILAYLAGATTTFTAYLAFRWIKRSAVKQAREEELVRLLDLFNADDLMYQQCTTRHISVLRMAEKAYDYIDDMYGIDVCDSLRPVVPLFVSAEIKDVMVLQIERAFERWNLKNWDAAARELSALAPSTLGGAYYAVSNLERYDFLGDQLIALGPFLANPKFSEIIDKVIFRPEITTPTVDLLCKHLNRFCVRAVIAFAHTYHTGDLVVQRANYLGVQMIENFEELLKIIVKQNSQLDRDNRDEPDNRDESESDDNHEQDNHEQDNHEQDNHEQDNREQDNHEQDNHEQDNHEQDNRDEPADRDLPSLTD